MVRMPVTHVETPRNDVVDDLFAGLLRLSRAMRTRSVDWTHASPDLTRGDLVALGVIHDRKSVRPSQIAVALSVDPSVVSRQLGTLERHQLIGRGPDPADRRAELITVTDAGRARMLVAREAMQQMLACRLGDWEVDDIVRAAATVESLADVLHLAPETPPKTPADHSSKTREAHA
jgi:DNA-binding MarR family transcriptional regulator